LEGGKGPYPHWKGYVRGRNRYKNITRNIRRGETIVRGERSDAKNI